MTRDEKRVDNLLIVAKGDARLAICILDPSPKEPVARAILKVMDAIDGAREELRKRGPGREDSSATGGMELDRRHAANE